MKRILLFVFLQLGFSFAANACLNYYYTLDKNNVLHYAGDGYDITKSFNTNFNKELLVSKMKKLDEQMAKDHSVMALSDYAVDLLKLGKVNEGLEILVKLYENSPNEYKLASNLGTAYELHGDIDSALKYIRRGIQLNPNDHDGSEWIHVKILEAKKEMAADTNWLNTHSVLELTERQKNDSVTRKQLRIQLQERFPFVPAPNAMMASMFEDLGDIYANTFSIEYAKAMYTIAREYYGNKSIVLQNKIKDIQKLSGKYSTIHLPNDHHSYEEGEESMLGFISYKTLLGDNDPDHYQVDWTKLNYDPKTLLVKVNLTMQVPAGKADSSQVKISAAPDSPAEKKDANRWGNLIWGITAFIILAGGVVVLGRKRSAKRRNKE